MTLGLPLSDWRIAAHVVVASLTASHALLTKRDPRAAWGWIAVCWLFPFAGAVLYYLFGINRVQTAARRMQGPPGISDFMPEMTASLPEPTGMMDALEIRELVRTGRAMTGRPLVGGNSITPYFNGEQAYPRMLEAIRGARRRINFATFIFLDDVTGDAFARALHEAIGRGVEVRLLLDGVGCTFYRPNPAPLLRRYQLHAARFLPMRWFPPMMYVNMRNHRKLLVVDDSVAFAGGMNIADYHIVEDRPGYRVADVHFEVRGALVQQLSAAFAADWQFAADETVSVEECREPAAGNAIARVITDGPNIDLDKLTMVLLGAFAAAHHRIWLMTPYFVPDARIISALQAASLRGVDVNLVVPEHSNLRYVDWASRHWLEDLLEREVKVYLRPAPFAHTKLVIIDDYVQFGSANLDARSLRLNFELMVEVFDAGLVETVQAHFTDVRSRSRLLPIEEIQSRSLPTRFRDAVAWLFSPYL